MQHPLRNAFAFLIFGLALALIAAPWCWTIAETYRHARERDVDMARQGYEQVYEQGPVKEYQPPQLIWRHKK